MKYLTIIITLFICQHTKVSAQRVCGSTMNLSSIQSNDPARYQRIMQMEQRVASYTNNNSRSLSSHQVITIPVVVHVLHTGQEFLQ